MNKYKNYLINHIRFGQMTKEEIKIGIFELTYTCSWLWSLGGMVTKMVIFLIFQATGRKSVAVMGREGAGDPEDPHDHLYLRCPIL